jgi:hypothetical protein
MMLFRHLSQPLFKMIRTKENRIRHKGHYSSCGKCGKATAKYKCMRCLTIFNFDKICRKKHCKSYHKNICRLQADKESLDRSFSKCVNDSTNGQFRTESPHKTLADDQRQYFQTQGLYQENSLWRTIANRFISGDWNDVSLGLALHCDKKSDQSSLLIITKPPDSIHEGSGIRFLTISLVYHIKTDSFHMNFSEHADGIHTRISYLSIGEGYEVPIGDRKLKFTNISEGALLECSDYVYVDWISGNFKFGTFESFQML